jgi:hypothetical protein
MAGGEGATSDPSKVLSLAGVEDVGTGIPPEEDDEDAPADHPATSLIERAGRALGEAMTPKPKPRGRMPRPGEDRT